MFHRIDPNIFLFSFFFHSCQGLHTLYVCANFIQLLKKITIWSMAVVCSMACFSRSVVNIYLCVYGLRQIWLLHKLVGILNIFEGDIFNFLGCFFSGHWSEFGRSTHLLEGRVHKTNGCRQGTSASWRTFCDLFNCWVIILFFSIWQPLSMYLCLG